jgi:hypothetical protein
MPISRITIGALEDLVRLEGVKGGQAGAATGECMNVSLAPAKGARTNA